jgi:probable F420-dependent oxidoreductase
VNYGVTLTGVGAMADPDKLRRAARKADQLGFHSLWLFDHVAFPATVPASYGKIHFTPETPFLSPIPTLAYLAAETKRIRLGTGVLLIALRHPLQVAKTVSTLDVLSEGRAMLGVGLGWLAEEFEALGVPFKERVGRVRESVHVLRKIWAAGKLEYRGRYYRFPETTSYPLPIQRGGPPIWFGGAAEPALQRAVELGDGWLGVAGSMESLGKRIRKVTAFAREAGKNNFTVAVGASPEIAADDVAQLREMGATHINFGFTSGEAAEIESKLESLAGKFLV